MSPIMSPEEIKNIFQSKFSEFSFVTIENLIRLGQILEFETNQTLINQGDFTNDVYFLITGSLQVILADNHCDQHFINTIPSGEVFGEMSLFNKEARSTTIKAIRHSLVLSISGEDFSQFMDENVEMYKHISTTLIQRLSQSNKGKGSTKSSISKNICFIPAHKDYDIQAYCKEIELSLSKHGKVLLLDKSTFESKGFENQSNFLSWFYKVEANYDFILLIGSYELDTWTQIVTGQSDKIMSVGRQESSKNVSPVEQAVLDYPSGQSLNNLYLILDSTHTSEIKNTRSCLENRSVKSLFHHRHQQDYARIARFIAGKSIKLVLSGGGARGFAHLGIYKALIEANIPIDFVCGTSIGAIMGALVACGWDYDIILQRAYKAFVEDKPLSDYQLPLISLLKGEKLDKALKDNFGDALIEDLGLPFFAVSANLSKLSTEIMDSGLLRQTLRASISLPSILPPVVVGNNLLLDGGIVDNMPYDPMQTLASGPTIGVDLSHVKERDLNYDKIPSNRKLALSKITRKKKYKVPNIYQIIMGTMTLASDEKKRSNIKNFDLYLQPDVAKFGFLDLKKFDKVVAAGYDSTVDQIKAWAKKQSF